MVDPAEKEAVHTLLNAYQRSSKRKSPFFLIARIGSGYAAMAAFTILALFFSALNLTAINKTAREITYRDLPAISALIKLRASLQAQERYAGKYAILKDSAFVDLFRTREREFVANLRILEQTGPIQDLAELKRNYLTYQQAAQRLLGGNPADPASHRASAAQLFESINSVYVKRQAKLHAVIEHAELQRKSAIKWTIIIACAGFLLTAWIAPWVTNRIFRATRKLQLATHRALSGDFSFPPQIQANDEILDLADDVTTMTKKLAELENLNFGPKQHAGDLTTEIFIEEQVQRGTGCALCDIRMNALDVVVAQHGFRKAADLLHLTGNLLRRAAIEHGCADGFLGHVGGDSFIVAVPPDRVESFSKRVIDRFETEVPAVLNPGAAEEDADPLSPHRPASVTTITISTILCGSGQAPAAAEVARAMDSFKGKRSGNFFRSGWDMVSFPFVAVVLAVSLLSGCATMQHQEGRQPTGPQMKESTQHATEAWSWRKMMGRQLDQAVRAIQRKDTQGAARRLKTIVNQRDVPGVTDEALFRLALLSMNPSMERPASERGIQLLKRLKRDFPRSSWAVQAEPLLELVDVAENLKAQSRSLSNAKEAVDAENRDLATKLKQLKRLDMELERTP
ncbi:HAMP domain protein [Citrifermentans bemidjiense Bem]|uniref:HAMP domain protein n=1 Tax=Citrifermentans bemidjiense (strain ATCC BAA-1014 / DSM 16622 / JCM 12645 / Bem) TaxID=404380 RepID=B5EGR5_CITBB|nr:methyl-accepting chemotaxis protein [Citrifermentans bemidjiense]ACH39548.1 HAMP domain protein [Citrifermentans bemidjiense Bem]